MNGSLLVLTPLGIAAAAAAPFGAQQVGEVFRDCDECPEMVVVPAGRFMMGSPESEEKRSAGLRTIRTPRMTGAPKDWRLTTVPFACCGPAFRAVLRGTSARLTAAGRCVLTAASASASAPECPTTTRTAVRGAPTVTALAAARAAAQSPDNPVCDADAPNLWKRDTRFVKVCWNDARPVHTAECLKAGADPNPIGGVESPLFWAVQRTDNLTVLHGVVAVLLYANTDMGPDRFGYTPPYHVLGDQPNSVAPVELLLEAGADPSGSWGSVTPLHHAAEHTTNPRVLDSGADVRTQKEAGNRPVDLASTFAVRLTGTSWYRKVCWHPDEHSTAASGRLTRSWDDGSHYDAWAMTTRAGQHVVIDMESDDVDAYLRVLRNDGTQTATDDDGGSGSNAGSNAREELRAPNARQYLVIATSFERGETGGYRVSAR